MAAPVEDNEDDGNKMPPIERPGSKQQRSKLFESINEVSVIKELD